MGTSSETATHVGGFSSTALSNKPDDNGVDGKRANGAAEIRQLKKILKDSFTNVTGAVTATHTQLNQLTTNTFTGDVSTTGDLLLNNNEFVKAKDTGGSYRGVIGLTSSDNTVIGGTASASVVWIEAGAPSNTLRLDSSGNVGIGTSTPDCKLDVAGYSKLGDSANAPQIKTEFLTGSVGAVGTSTTVTTSVTLAQIISVNALVNDSGGGAVAPGWGGLYDYGLAVNNSGNVVLTIGGSSSAVASQNYRVFVVYKAA